MQASSAVLARSAWQGWTDLLRGTYAAASVSADPSTQLAAVLVRMDPDCPHGGSPLAETWAINDLPAGVVNHPERWVKPLKYDVVEHAERNAIYAAARLGIATQGTAVVCPWKPCIECARAIIQAGVRVVVSHARANARLSVRWAQSIGLAELMLEEAGVELVEVQGALGAVEVRSAGAMWRP